MTNAKRNIEQEVTNIVEQYLSITSLQKNIEAYTKGTSDIPKSLLSNKFLVLISNAKKDLVSKINEYQSLSETYEDSSEKNVLTLAMSRLEMTLNEINVVENSVKNIVKSNDALISKKAILSTHKSSIETDNTKIDNVKANIELQELRIKSDKQKGTITFDESEYTKELELVNNLESALTSFKSFKKTFNINVDDEFESTIDSDHAKLLSFLNAANSFLQNMENMNDVIQYIKSFKASFNKISHVVNNEYVKDIDTYINYTFSELVFDKGYEKAVKKYMAQHKECIDISEEYKSVSNYVEAITFRAKQLSGLIYSKNTKFANYISSLNSGKVSLSRFSEIESVYNDVIENTDIVKSLKAEYLEYFNQFDGEFNDDNNIAEKIKEQYSKVDTIIELASDGVDSLEINNIDTAELIYEKIKDIESIYSNYLHALNTANQAINNAKDEISSMNSNNYRRADVRDSNDLLIGMGLGYIAQQLESEQNARIRHIEAEIERERQEEIRREQERQRREREEEEAAERRRQEASRQSSYSSSSSSDDWGSSSSSSSSGSSSYGGGSDSSW